VLNYIHDSDPNIIAEKLLDWYDQNARILPWREPPYSTQIPDPYKVWLSEIMLQQTQVVTVIDYFLKFIKRWPTVSDLANAKEDEIMHAWAGLGYYSRARNLHKCAKEVVTKYQGVFPKDEMSLQALPGIGPYTSAAVASIAFNQRANVIDGNIERVMARFLRFESFLPKAKKELLLEIEPFIHSSRPGDYAQALMDLGATICTVKNPNCAHCPLSFTCAAFKNDAIQYYPRKKKREKTPHKFGYLYLIQNDQREIGIEKRAANEMLGGLYGFPTSDWRVGEFSHSGKYGEMIENLEIIETNHKIIHVFTNFKLTLIVVKGKKK